MTNPLLRAWFAEYGLLRAVIDTVLEDRGGEIRCLGVEPMTAAILSYGCYHAPGGDPTSEQARELVADLRGPCEIVVPDADWRELLSSVHGDRLADRSMRSYVPGPELAHRTAALARSVPDGYALARLDAESAARIGPALSPHGVGVMGGPAAFIRDGFGWAVLEGAEPVCVATSYGVSAAAVEVAIATHPDHRRRGLAACASSAMIQEALVREREPHWNAHNPVSMRLAERLGFAFTGIVEILFLAPAAGVQPAT